MDKFKNLDGGSANPDINPMLRSAIDEALRRYVPKATVTLFLKKMSDSKDKTAIQRYIFEGRLFKRMYVVISIFADNYALTKIQMATVFRKHLVEQIQAKRMFNERGVFNVIARDGISIENIEEECLNDAVECGADDIEVYNATERQVTFFCDPKDFLKVRHKLSTAGHKIEQSECAFFPNNKLVQLTEAELKDYNKFKERLLAIDGFDEIYDNVEDDDS